MDAKNDLKGAIKKLKHLTFTSKSEVSSFRKKMENEFNSFFLPNGVECSTRKYANIDCDILAPEIYASNRIMLYIHGGSFVGGSRTVYKNFCSSLAAKCFCRVVVPEYRLAPENLYPSPIEDIQEVFRALFTEEQIACSLNGENTIPEIIIAADGSAAPIACSFIFNLRERYKKCIKQIIFFSPWLNVSQESKLLTTRKMCDDVMSGDVLRKSSCIFAGETSPGSPFISPLLADDEQLKDFPPLFIQMGEKEILLEDAQNFTNRMTELGNKCTLDVWEKMIYMFQMADEFIHESHLALDKIGWVVTTNQSEHKKMEFQNKPKLEHSLNSEA
ncbi:MAG: alpha/beta hydrolase [Treponema sp.]|nr:alpha/beta hydrolase [Treponema sp.]